MLKRLLESGGELAGGAGLLYGVVAAPDAAPRWIGDSPLTRWVVLWWWLVLWARPLVFLLGLALLAAGLLTLLGIPVKKPVNYLVRLVRRSRVEPVEQDDGTVVVRLDEPVAQAITDIDNRLRGALVMRPDFGRLRALDELAIAELPPEYVDRWRDLKELPDVDSHGRDAFGRRRMTRDELSHAYIDAAQDRLALLGALSFIDLVNTADAARSQESKITEVLSTAKNLRQTFEWHLGRPAPSRLVADWRGLEQFVERRVDLLATEYWAFHERPQVDLDAPVTEQTLKVLDGQIAVLSRVYERITGTPE